MINISLCVCVCVISFNSLKTTDTFILFYFFPEIQISWLVYGWEYGKPTCSCFWAFTTKPLVNLVHFLCFLVSLTEQPIHCCCCSVFSKNHGALGNYLPSSVWRLSFGLQDSDWLSGHIQSITSWSSIRCQDLTNAWGEEWLTAAC